jgi:hypothetical protein
VVFPPPLFCSLLQSMATSILEDAGRSRKSRVEADHTPKVKDKDKVSQPRASVPIWGHALPCPVTCTRGAGLDEVAAEEDEEEGGVKETSQSRDKTPPLPSPMKAKEERLRKAERGEQCLEQKEGADSLLGTASWLKGAQAQVREQEASKALRTDAGTRRYSKKRVHGPLRGSMGGSGGQDDWVCRDEDDVGEDGDDGGRSGEDVQRSQQMPTDTVFDLVPCDDADDAGDHFRVSDLGLRLYSVEGSGFRIVWTLICCPLMPQMKQVTTF